MPQPATKFTDHEIENLIGQRDDAMFRLEELQQRVDKHASEIAAAVEKASQAGVAEIAELRVQLTESQSLCAALGGTKLGKQMIRQQRKEKAIKDKAALETLLAQLDQEESNDGE